MIEEEEEEEEAYKPTKLLEAPSKLISAVQAAEDHTVGKRLTTGKRGMKGQERNTRKRTEREKE